jgi:hypothetical protein
LDYEDLLEKQNTRMSVPKFVAKLT